MDSAAAKGEVTARQKHGGAPFGNKGLVDAEFLVDELDFRACPTRTEHERELLVLQAVQRPARRGIDGKGMRLKQRVVQIGKHHNRRHGLHISHLMNSTRRLLASSPQPYPVGPVFSTLKLWRRRLQLLSLAIRCGCDET